jgi:hypothetical protein
MWDFTKPVIAWRPSFQIILVKFFYIFQVAAPEKNTRHVREVSILLLLTHPVQNNKFYI